MIPSLYKPFQNWSKTGSVYILSDLHFGDSACSFMDPGWVSPEEQVKIINTLATKNDTFICLGDVGDSGYVKSLKAGKKVLILGNHDSRGAYTDCFDEIYSGPLFISDKILLSHEPVNGLPWCLNIHGHDHANATVFDEGCNHINLAANVCGYKPTNLGKLIESGALSSIPTIHRMTIDKAIKRKHHSELQSVQKNTGLIERIKQILHLS